MTCGQRRFVGTHIVSKCFGSQRRCHPYPTETQTCPGLSRRAMDDRAAQLHPRWEVRRDFQGLPIGSRRPLVVVLHEDPAAQGESESKSVVGNLGRTVAKVSTIRRVCSLRYIGHCDSSCRQCLSIQSIISNTCADNTSELGKPFDVTVDQHSSG